METELERMLVRLVGDATSYQKMMVDAQKSSQDTAKKVEESAKQIERMKGGLDDFAKSAAGALGTLGISTSFWGAFEKFAEKEKAIIRLNAAIEGNGKEVAKTMKDYEDFAKSVAAETLLTKGSVMAMVTKAEMMGIQGDEAKNLIKMSVALAGATGQEADSMFRVAKMIQGGHPELAKRVLNLQGIKNESELVAKVTERMALGWKVAVAEAESTSGQIAKLKKAFAGLTLEVGGLVAEVVKPVVAWLTEATKLFNGLDPAIKKVVAQIIFGIAAFLALQPALTTLTYLLAPVTTAFKLLFVVLGALLSPWGLVIAAVAAAGAAVIYWTESGGVMLDWFTNMWSKLQEEIQPAIDGITSALRGGNLQLAFEILWAQVKLSTRKAFQDMEMMWYAFQNIINVGAIKTGHAVLTTWTKIITNIRVVMEDDIDRRGQLILDMERDLKSFEASKKKALREAELAGQAQVAGLQNDLRLLEEQRNTLVERAAGEAAKALKKNLPPNLPPSVKPIHLVAKFDAAAYGSAEAFGRFQAFIDKARAQEQGLGGVVGAKPAPAVPIIGADALRRLEEGAAARGEGARPVALLTDIRDDMRALVNRPALEVEPAGLA